jgi:hypothetical protein
MFVVVTVFAVFVGYHVNWIRQRQDAEASANWYRLSTDESGIDLILKKPRPRAPGLLWLFGENGHSQCLLFFGYQPTEHFTYSNRELTPLEQSEVSRIKRLFPEARIEAEASVAYPSLSQQPK